MSLRGGRRPKQSVLSPWELYQSVYASKPRSFFLDSIDHQSTGQRYSYLGADPFLEIVMQNGRITVSGEERGHYAASQLFSLLRRLFKKYRRPQNADYFTGGGVGYWGYELAPLFDKVKFRKKPDPGMPPLYLGFFRDVVVYDHVKERYYPTPVIASLRSRRSNLLLKPDCFVAPVGAPRNDRGSHFHFKKFRAELSRSQFESMVRRAKEYIESGDIYQANLSQRFVFEFEGSPLRLYAALRKINPSPFASFLNLGDLKIISSSPERLVSKKGRYCETRPIAGTRPQPPDKKLARLLERELRENAKERAEHIMLVDLERNDLGRVCDFKSVRVEELMKVEKYSHVMHLVSKITGRLQPAKDALDLLKAVFPGGTVTGCPKIHCMEIIDELEPVRRGIYTGSIGYLDFNGNMDLNIVIRTLILQQNKGYLQVGAGIVYDSDPAREYDETLQKGEALAQALVEASL